MTKRSINGVIEQLATELRHTPAVCRKSYINPIVFDAWRHGKLRQPATATVLKLLRRS